MYLYYGNHIIFINLLSSLYIDHQWVFYLDGWTTNPFQCGYQNPIWWAEFHLNFMHRLFPLTLDPFVRPGWSLATFWLFVFLLHFIWIPWTQTNASRSADHDRRPGGLWEIVSASGRAGRDAEGFRHGDVEQVSHRSLSHALHWPVNH